MPHFGYQSLVAHIARRMCEGLITPSDAVDNLALLDPDTEVGRALTDVMLDVTNLELLDHYVGYDREDGRVRLYFTPYARPDKLKELKMRIDDGELRYQRDPMNPAATLLRSKLYKTEEELKDALYVLELYYEADADDIEVSADVPSKVNIQGDITPTDKQETE